MAVVSWTYAETQEEYAKQAKRDAAQLVGKFWVILKNIGLPGDTQVHFAMHQGGLADDKPLDKQWRTLFAQAILKLEHLGQDN